MTQRLIFNPDGRLIEIGFSLSPRLVEVLSLRLRQYSISEIAQALVIEPNTVSGYLRDLHQTLNVHSRRELFAWAEAANLISLDQRLTNTK